MIDGLEVAQQSIAQAHAALDHGGGTQIVSHVIGSTMQGPGYFPRPVCRAQCHAGDADCEKEGNGIGLARRSMQTRQIVACEPIRL